jgi:lipid-A-disaccharide synthase
MSPRSIYFVAGEASADNHGAALLASLREIDADFHFLGRGGPRMQAIAGGNFKNWIDEAAVVGLWEVIKRYGYFRKQFGEALNEIVRSKPDAVVLIDYPGFNLRLARRLHSAFAKDTADRRQSVVPKIIYYISPQVWAWNRRRIKQMAQQLDLMLCIFPFEADLYNQSGLRTIFVGHPMIDSLPAHKSANRKDSSRGEIDNQRDPNLIALLPGSRGREVRKIFPILLEVASTLRKTKSRLRFEIAAASPALAGETRQMLDRFALGGRDQPSFEVRVGEAAALMQRAFAGIVASGSATLEATYFRMPFVLVYKVAWLTYFAARLVVKVKYLGMPNVLANKEVVPEFIQHRATSRAIAEAVARLLDNDEARRQMIFEFDAIAGKLGQGGASARAARAICEEISR